MTTIEIRKARTAAQPRDAKGRFVKHAERSWPMFRIGEDRVDGDSEVAPAPAPVFVARPSVVYRAWRAVVSVFVPTSFRGRAVYGA